MWVTYALLSAFFAALVAIFAKIGLKAVDPTMATAVRAVLMAVFFVCAVVALKKFDTAIFSSTPKEWMYIVFAAIAGALSWFFYFIALRDGTATGVAALDRLSIVFVIVFAALLLGESITWLKGAGVLLIALGAIMVAL